MREASKSWRAKVRFLRFSHQQVVALGICDNENTMKKFYLFLWMSLFTFSLRAAVETSENVTCKVGVSTRLEVPDPPVGYIDYEKWTCENSNIILDRGTTGVAYIRATKYFDEIATVECLYVAKWYDDRNFTQQTTYLRTFYVTCIDNGSSGEEDLVVSITPNGGEFLPGKMISMKCNQSEAKIYFTDDGSTPDETSERYYESFRLDESMTIKAVAIYNNLKSNITSATFTISEEGQKFFLTNEGIKVKYYQGRRKVNNLYEYYAIIGTSTNYYAVDSEITGQIVIPSSIEDLTIKSINSYAFYCSHLKEMYLSEGLDNISKNAFYLASLEKIIFPSSLKTINNYAFDLCFLKDIYIKAKTPPTIYDNSFESLTNKSATLYVPKGCKQAYASAKGWSKFNKIIEVDSFPDGFSSSIQEVNCQSESSQPIYYNLNGVRIENPQHGIYIVVRGDRVEKRIID